MPVSVENAFLPSEESIDWAEGATNELNASIDSFFKRDVAEIVVEIDRDTGDNVQKLKFKAAIPKDFRRKATEALNNARHSFDQSMFAARNILGKRSAKGINYPWAQDLTDLNRLLRARAVDPRLWDTIRAHAPYHASGTHAGGDNLIRTLATIANNKHTVGLAVNGLIEQTRFPDITGGTMSLMAPRWDPRKNEADLLRWQGDIEIKGDYKFTFVMCLEDSRLSEPVDAIFALRGFTQKAKRVCQTIKAKCLELRS